MARDVDSVLLHLMPALLVAITLIQGADAQDRPGWQQSTRSSAVGNRAQNNNARSVPPPTSRGGSWQPQFPSTSLSGRGQYVPQNPFAVRNPEVGSAGARNTWSGDRSGRTSRGSSNTPGAFQQVPSTVGMRDQMQQRQGRASTGGYQPAQRGTHEQQSQRASFNVRPSVVYSSPYVGFVPQHPDNCVLFLKDDLHIPLPSGLVTWQSKLAIANVSVARPWKGLVALIQVSSGQYAANGHMALVTNVTDTSITILEAHYGGTRIDERTATAPNLQQAQRLLQIVAYYAPP